MPALPATQAKGLSVSPPTIFTSSSHQSLASQLYILLLACLLLLGACWKLRRRLLGNMNIPDRSIEKKPSKSLSPVDSGCGSSPEKETPPLESPPISLGQIWVAPPNPLPGPYDPRLFPSLPCPTIKRHSVSEPAKENGEIITATYIRKVSAQADEGEKTLYGYVSRGGLEQGWRRTQWTVGAG